MVKDLSSVNVKVQGRSGFDKSFKNILTTNVGVITPIVSKLVIPGSKGQMKIAISAALPPLASDTFMRADLKVEAFLVPMRLLYGGFEAWLTSSKIHSSGTLVNAGLPVLQIDTADASYVAPGKLADYLGMCSNASNVEGMKFNIFPFLAYHRVYDDWYRNGKVQAPTFVPFDCSAGNTDSLTSLRHLPFSAFKGEQVYNLKDLVRSPSWHLGGLYHRNYADDYFTIATPSAQRGTEQKVTIDSNNQFTISSLRAANSLQQWEERQNLASPRMVDYVKAVYGANLSSGVAQRAILLGSASYPVYSKGINAQSDTTATNNPFTSVGARYGNAFASGTDFVCNFEANEPCYLMVMATLMPEANYAGGVDHGLRILNTQASQVDIPNPMLQNIGNEPIMKSEVLLSSTNQTVFSDGVFGYVQRYQHHKTGLNQVHGLLRYGQSLQSFVAQRLFSIDAEISSSFLTSTSNDLDNVTAVTADLSTYGCWIDSFIDLKVSEPLAESSLPSLQDPAYEHGYDVNMRINGSKL